MTNITITLPESHTVRKGPKDKAWLVEVTAQLAKLSPEIVAALAVHGLQQKIADSASQAKTEAEASAAMNKALDALLRGEWSSRSAASGVDEFTAMARSVVRKAMKDQLGAKSPEWAKFTGYDDATQAEKLDANYAAHESVFKPIVEKRLAEKREKVSGVTFAI